MWSHSEKINTNIPDLEVDEIYISHVGDGEYSFNTFGSAHLNLMKLFKNLAKQLGCEILDLNIVQYTNPNTGLPNDVYYIELGGQDQMCITIEKLDPESFSWGG